MQDIIAKKIKEIRYKSNLSQDRFGKKIGLTGKAVSAYETGRSTPPLKVLDSISKVYNTPLISMREEQKTDLDNKIRIIEEYLNEVRRLLTF